MLGVRVIYYEAASSSINAETYVSAPHEGALVTYFLLLEILDLFTNKLDFFFE